MVSKVSILIATYNRADILRETLEAMAELDAAKELHAEWIVVDNNSRDDTRQVVESFKGRLPVVYLFEPNPGKNCALNKALNEVKLGEIVVFADDDVSPRRDWLEQIVASSARWSHHDVFGGKIDLLWPGNKQPEWLSGASEWILSVGFSWHDFGETEKLYEKESFPFGPNYWLRRTIFDRGHRFDESIGPKGNGRIMGSETSLLRKLAQEGQQMIYCPKAVVQHRIKQMDSDTGVLIKRAFSMGRGSARMLGVNYHNLLNTHPAYWHLRQFAKLIIVHIRLAAAKCRLQKRAKMESMLPRYADLGRTMEAFKMAREKKI